ncbi:MAG: PrsW family intramembrane metalloprotease [Candidatus Edwardsbacteria bacterium]
MPRYLEISGIILLSLLGAGIPTFLYVLLIWWLDRYEKEPISLLIVAFLWGSIFSVLVSLFIEILLGIPLSLLQEHLACYLESGVVSPVVEELAKGIMLLLFFLFASREFDDVLDGIIYGAMIGAGFGMSENLLYFLSHYSKTNFAEWGILMAFRSGLFGLNHTLYTSLTGAGFGLARYSPKIYKKILIPLFGFFLAVIVHAGHNLFLELSKTHRWTLLLSVVNVWTWTIVLFIAAILCWRQEKGWLRQELKEEVENGILSMSEYLILLSYWRRARIWWKKIFKEGRKGAREWAKFCQVTSELAFKKHELSFVKDKEARKIEIETLRVEINDISKKYS